MVRSNQVSILVLSKTQFSPVTIVKPDCSISSFFFLIFENDKMYLEHLQHLTDRFQVGSWGQTSLALVWRFIFQHFLEGCLYMQYFLEFTISSRCQLSSFPSHISFRLYRLLVFFYGAVFSFFVCIDHGDLTLNLQVLICKYVISCSLQCHIFDNVGLTVFVVRLHYVQK